MLYCYCYCACLLLFSAWRKRPNRKPPVGMLQVSRMLQRFIVPSELFERVLFIEIRQAAPRRAVRGNNHYLISQYPPPIFVIQEVPLLLLLLLLLRILLFVALASGRQDAPTEAPSSPSSDIVELVVCV